MVSAKACAVIALMGCALLVFIRRERIRENYVDIWERQRNFLNRGIRLNNGFSEDIEAGFTSRNFDLSSHNADDQRDGLDDEAKNEIKQIMQQDRVDFDQARFIYLKQKLGNNNIAANGMPLDPKAVTFRTS
ncbi:LAME_0E10066g1_1 [Lachancea meyersii CBS 8951]|uniref:LAME_0E10066g1_1 n=1 Tax=Lachancea meyersii CBS 8951 TaxID=1266667 RepID=A0A1G4JKI8_9SACH|nr:LAME_0E10066g1_1 [Lachancea meyersii CBS 8951]